MYDRQRFPLWPVWGNDLGHSSFLAVTLSSGQVEWSASPSSHSFEVHNCEQFRRMVFYRRLVQDRHFLRKWSRQSFPRADSSSPSCTVISARGMAKLSEWSRFSNQGQAFPRVDSFSLGCTVISVGRMAQ
jgi:hypothetical protein